MNDLCLDLDIELQSEDVQVTLPKSLIELSITNMFAKNTLN